MAKYIILTDEGEWKDTDVCPECDNADCICPPVCPECEEEECICCASCGSQWCSCCAICGSECSCCGDCGETEESCSCHGHGTSPRPPWVDRGIHIGASDGPGDWKQVWPEIDSSIDPVMAAADFYLLEAISSSALYTYELPAVDSLTVEQENEMFTMLGINSRLARELVRKDMRAQVKELRKSHPGFAVRDIEEKAQKLQRELVEILDRSFVPYVHIAIGGEIRHHKAMGEHLSGERNEAWADWRRVFEAVGTEALLDVEKLFIEFGDNNSYGGPAWAEATKVLWRRHEKLLGPDDYLNKKLFVDRVFSLQHNGGALLDKIGWSIKNTRQWCVSAMKDLLDMHASDVPDVPGLTRVCSPKVKNLICEYVEAAKTLTPTDKKFEYLSLSAAINKAPILLCMECGTNLAYGHFGGCTNFLLANERLEFNHLKMRTWWEDDLVPPRMKDRRLLTDLPYDAWGKGKIEPDAEFQVRLNGELTQRRVNRTVDVSINALMKASEIAAGIEIPMEGIAVGDPYDWSTYLNITILKKGDKQAWFNWPSWDTPRFLRWDAGKPLFKFDNFINAVKS